MQELNSIPELRQAQGQPAPDFLTPPPPIGEAYVTETLEADIVVVGEGMSGLCCALSARQQGADVLIVTASKKPVGRGGSIFAAYSKVMAEAGLPRTDLDKFLLEEMEARSFQLDQRKFYGFINHSEEAMDWITDIVRAKGLDVVLEDVNRDDADSPTYQPPGTHGFTVPGASRAGVGIIPGLQALEDTYLEAGGRIVRSTPAEQLEKTDGRVCAVLARKGDGSYLRAKARKGVVLATGDFSRNREMMEFFCPQFAGGFLPDKPDYDLGFSSGGLFQGEGHLMALWAGAAWQRTYPCAVMIQGSRVCSNQPFGSHRGLRLNARGERYCNEDMNGAYTALTTLREPGGKAFIIWGSNYARDIPWRAHGGQRSSPDMTEAEILRNWEGQIEKGKAVRADTLEEVIEALGLPMEQTLAEIERYNALCRAGYDSDFHKSPKYLQEIREAPFYGASLSDRLFFTVLGGPRTNYKMQVCDSGDEPIPGLYCVGSMMGDFYAGCYNFRICGENYGVCLCFGYRTGKLLAEGKI